MPFEKGNKLAKGIGRRGYEYEQAQLKKMSQILNRALVMTEHIQLNKANIREAMAYENSLKLVSKIMDKLHANRQHIEMEGGEIPFKFIEVSKINKDGADPVKKG